MAQASPPARRWSRRQGRRGAPSRVALDELRRRLLEVGRVPRRNAEIGPGPRAPRTSRWPDPRQVGGEPHRHAEVDPRQIDRRRRRPAKSESLCPSASWCYSWRRRPSRITVTGVTPSAFVGAETRFDHQSGAARASSGIVLKRRDRPIRRGFETLFSIVGKALHLKLATTGRYGLQSSARPGAPPCLVASLRYPPHRPRTPR